MKRTLLERFMEKVREEPNTGCWLWAGMLVPDGYGSLLIAKNKRRGAHRVAWNLFRGEIPGGYLVCHKCDIRNCVNPDHLFLGTPADNSRDMVEKNRHPFGEKNYASKLTSSQVSRIKELLAAGTPRRKIAAAFGVCRVTISDIYRGKSWKHVQGPVVATPAIANPAQKAVGANGRNQKPILRHNTANTGGKMSTFPPAFEFVMNHEDPQRSGKVTEDAGGRTRFGIAQKFHPELKAEFFSAPPEDAMKQAEEVLRRDYWERMRLSEVNNQNVANKLFDMAVNMGVHQAGVYAQRAANGLITAQVALPSAVAQRSRAAAASAEGRGVAGGTATVADPYADLRPLVPMFRLAEDGVLGDKSLAAINAFDPIAYYQLLCDLSRQHYIHVASINPPQSANLQGWLKRAAA